MADHLFGITDKGRERTNNEDVFIATEVMDGQFIIAGVIDGVGGYEGGEIAAALTKDIILEELSVIGSDLDRQMELAFDLANEEILARKLVSSELSGMACVATIAVIDRRNNLLHYIHVGDTRLYLFRDKSLVKLSHDQSFVGFLEDSGRLTEEAAMQHPKRNQINQALGLESRMGSADAYFEISSSPFLPGDLVLLCSDGLTDMVDKKDISATLNTEGSLEAKASALIRLANDAGGKDNITVVLAKNNKVPQQHQPARPAAASPAAVPPLREPVAASASVPASVEHQSNVAPSPSPSPSEERHVNPPKNSGLTILLSVFCLLLLATSIWLYISHLPANPPVTTVVRPAVPRLNQQEKMLHQLLDSLKGDTLRLSDTVFRQPIVLSRPLFIKKDSLVIKVSGQIVLQSDLEYKGAALVLPATAKYVSVGQLVIQGFEVGIVTYNHALDLKNTQFINCKQAVETSFVFPNRSYVNGRISKRAYQADSVATK